MKIIIITQARFSSSRLPGKVLKLINDTSLLEIHLKRLKRSQLANKIIVATTNEVEAQQIVEIAHRLKCHSYRGSMDDVLDRFYKAAKAEEADVIVRVTSDCPLNDGMLIDTLIEDFLNSGVDYLSNVHPPTYPDGLDIEIFSFEALEKAWSQSTTSRDREHVTPFIWANKTLFKLKNISQMVDQSDIRVTVDTIEDFNVIETLINELGISESWKKYIEFLSSHPEIMKKNSNSKRNEGFK